MRSIISLALAAAVVAPAAAAAQPSITIKKATVSRSVVDLRVNISGFKMLPKRIGKKPNTAAAGHWHVFVDGKYNNASANATTGATLKLTPRSHTIRVELANNDHSSLAPAVRSKAVTVRVG